eukprot:TRINITY_DN15568_c0_g1_i2.p1 TRINITY_DN15568_c0_g1~~TRINITY_DN15568_c0_g1_i2.p1  ORF type:complete len:582 (+),score=133.97 TRINITY_DN15568_c0_g1_i2:116-1861(+)
MEASGERRRAPPPGRPASRSASAERPASRPASRHASAERPESRHASRHSSRPASPDASAEQPADRSASRPSSARRGSSRDASAERRPSSGRRTVFTEAELEGLEFDLQDMSARIQEVFQKFDKDGSGYLDQIELRQVFRMLSPKFDSKQISHYCKWLNEAGDGDGQISHKEFIGWLVESGPAAQEVSRIIIAETGSSISNRLRELFQRFDKDGGGYLDMMELSKVFRILSPNFGMHEIQEICKELDRGGDRRVSRKEFMQWLKKGGEKAQLVKRAILNTTGKLREERISLAFKRYETGGDGVMDINELHVALHNLGSLSLDEVKRVCADLDKTNDGFISYEEFSAWIKNGTGSKEVEKAKAILAPSDDDGLEAVFYNFCGAGKADLDGKGFLKVCEDCGLLDKKMNVTAVDIIFSDTRVKTKGHRTIDFPQFEAALELLADKKGVERQEVRNKVLLQGKPVYTATKVKKAVRKLRIMKAEVVKTDANEDTGEEKLRIKDRRKSFDITSVWKVFGLHTSAGRCLKTIYSKDKPPPRVRPWAERVGMPKRYQNPMPSRKPRSHVIPSDALLDICVQVVSQDVC